MAEAIDHSIDRLNGVIEATAEGLASEAADGLRGAARRSGLALYWLKAQLTGQGVGVELQGAESSESAISCRVQFPKLPETRARAFLRELDGIIVDVEREVLAPSERELSGPELVEVKRAIGQAWGWIICDLQEPVWKQYPDAAPQR